MKKETQERLEILLDRNDALDVSTVLEDATDPKSPLHHEFEWDDSVAAVAHRKWQARGLIKRYSFIVTKREPRSQLIHVPSPSGTEGEYKPISAVIQSQSEFARALSASLGRLESAKREVESLRQMMHKSDSDQGAIIEVALSSISAATMALARLH